MWYGSSIQQHIELKCLEEGGYCTSPKLACFVLYVKIIKIFLKNNIYVSYSKLSKDLQNDIKI